MPKDIRKEFLNRFGQNLRKLRVEKKFSQRELSSLCSIDHSDISKIERGEINITLLSVLELSSALGLQPKSLLDF